MARVNLAVFSGIVLVLIQCQLTRSQQLSYQNADIGQVLIRPHTATTVHPPNGTVVYLPRSTTPTPAHLTTTKSSFFGNIRNFFSRGSTSTVTAVITTTTRRPAQAALPTIARNTNNININHNTLRNGAQTPLINSQNQFIQAESNKQPAGTPQMPPSVPNQSSTVKVVPIISTTTTARPTPTATTTTTQRSAIPHNPSVEEFPPLAPPRQNRPSASSTVAPLPNAWAALTTTTTTTTMRPRAAHASHPSTPERRPSDPNPLSRTQSSSSIISIDSRNEYNNQKGSSPQPAELATDTEIEELTETLFKKSSPNLYPFITINLQKKTRSSKVDDEAPLPLLTLNESIFDEIPTIVKLRALFNNYELDSMVNEYVSPIERQEENDFIDELLKTSVMKAAMKFLQDKGVVTADPKTHFNLLKTIWFNLYSRGQGKIGSSAFEHVFMAEIKNDSLTGLHNWIWYYYREHETGQNHVIDYKGYMKSIQLGDKAQVIKYRFSFDQMNKPVNTMFVGTPVELDMALYTVCFEVNKNECHVSLDGNKFIIRTYPFKYRGKRLIGSAFPEI